MIRNFINLICTAFVILMCADLQAAERKMPLSYADIDAVIQVDFENVEEIDSNKNEIRYYPVSSVIFKNDPKLNGFKFLDKAKLLNGRASDLMTGIVTCYVILSKKGETVSIIFYYGKSRFSLVKGYSKNGLYYVNEKSEDYYFSDNNLAKWVELKIDQEFGIKGKEVKKSRQSVNRIFDRMNRAKNGKNNPNNTKKTTTTP